MNVKFDDAALRQRFRDYLKAAGARAGDQRMELSVPIIAVIREFVARVKPEEFAPLLKRERKLKKQREADAIDVDEIPSTQSRELGAGTETGPVVPPVVFPPGSLGGHGGAKDQGESHQPKTRKGAKGGR